MKRCLQALALRFSDALVTVDETVFNAARIWKVYGTTACKGDNTVERPHRQAKLLRVPDEIGFVSINKLTALADTAPKPAAKNVGPSTFSLDRWISDHGLDVIGPTDWNGGRKWIFRICPWNDGHRNRSAYIVQFSSGAIAAGCHHNGCSGNDWAALRGVYQPDYRNKPGNYTETRHGVEAPGGEQGLGEPPVDIADGVGARSIAGPLGSEMPKALIDAAPGVLGSYIGWYLSAARNPEPVYAVASGIGFMSAAIGMRRHLPDCFLNTGILTIGPTESGKETIRRKLEDAIGCITLQLGREGVYIKNIESRFSSGAAVWWTLHESRSHAAFLFDTELGRLLAAATMHNHLLYDIVDAMLKVHDAVERERVLPIRYSARQKKGVRDMDTLANPFLCVHGTGTPRFYTEARALAGEDGSLNRLLILHCEGRAELRATEPCVPFPEEILKFFQDFSHPRVTLTYATGVEEYRRDRTVDVRERIDAAPGTWGRYGIKSSRFALLSAVCRNSPVVSMGDMKWACDVVWEASDGATRQFEAAGGLAYSECDALERAILAAHETPTVVANGGRLTRKLLSQFCRKWKESDFQMRDRALISLERADAIVFDQQRVWWTKK